MAQCIMPVLEVLEVGTCTGCKCEYFLKDGMFKAHPGRGGIPMCPGVEQLPENVRLASHEDVDRATDFNAPLPPV